MRCLYCNELMNVQDNDYMGNREYSRLYVCLNDESRSIYEDWTDDKGRPIPRKNKWWNPKDNEKDSEAP
ncbi:hypothetical protein PM3016_5452 [Paenibacillus mucilaginosus 3016]|uniref:Uncharacterized protein n=1 Tax=Paenibacillus mucilaginosus 3016 TaxID=1116391 RepID=H6NDV3_9BACL|nr:hypothetical protein PM3016_5452 [Paenibacillus mucilaginosus 3016]